MATVKVLVHKCLQKIEGYIPPGTKCGCRKWISIPKAMIMVEEGDAAYVITEMRISEVDEPCRLCGGLPGFQKYCGECRASGTVKVRKLFTVQGENIYLTSAKKTPRTPTLEKAHVERAITGKQADIDRIEYYGNLGILLLGELGAQIMDAKTGEIIKPGKPEPKDDASKGEGERYDYGRSV
jgi:hypothetical protein